MSILGFNFTEKIVPIKRISDINQSKYISSNYKQDIMLRESNKFESNHEVMYKLSNNKSQTTSFNLKDMEPIRCKSEYNFHKPSSSSIINVNILPKFTITKETL